MINIPEFIICHHSLTKDGKTVSWQAVREYHINTLKFEDIGYHYGIELIDKRHEILIGRMPNYHGAHCYQQGMNHRSIGILFMGNFDLEKPSKEMLNMGIVLIRFLVDLYKIPRANVKGHRDFAPYKSCPGTFFSVNELRNQL